MEIVIIEKKTYEDLIARIDYLHGKMQELNIKYGFKSVGKWHDNQDACLLLRISPRKLQTLRDTGKINFSQINHKIFYKHEDIENYINNKSKSNR